MRSVAILLATYNGERFIEEQLDSLMNQTQKPDLIIISDDHSSDGTWDILQRWRAKYMDVIEIHKNTTGRHGHVGNFSYLCELAKKSDCDYFLFCDQDDVWLKEKSQLLLSECIEQEALHSPDFPILVHSDLIVVDEQLNEIAPSFFKYQGLPLASVLSFPKFLIQNNVTGCASLINRALLEKATPLPNEVMVHDWWFALVAKAEGSLCFFDKALIKYRQHGGNAIGAKGAHNSLGFKRVTQQAEQLIRGIKHIKSSLLQMQDLNPFISGPVKEDIGRLINFSNLSHRERVLTVKEIANNPSSHLEVSAIYLALLAYSRN